MAIDSAKLDEMQKRYKAAVDAWVEAIRREEALASVGHDEAKLDEWENAAFAEEAARNQAKAAKGGYESALRQELFNF
jgi:hypothetical protein